jgi:ABC-type metal ion transport system, periplasmic component/surface adhesin
MEKALEQAKKEGVPFFTASEHVTVRRVGSGEGIPGDDPDQAAGAEDPHLWTDPLAAKAVVDALSADIESRFGFKVEGQREVMDRELEALDVEIKAKVEALPVEKRRLVTGHESLGYFAQRYGFKLVGAVVPGLSSAAESSAAELSALKDSIRATGVSVIFTEVGTPRQVVDALAKEAGVKTIQLGTHALPADGLYYSFERELASTIVEGLR